MAASLAHDETIHSTARQGGTAGWEGVSGPPYLVLPEINVTFGYVVSLSCVSNWTRYVRRCNKGLTQGLTHRHTQLVHLLIHCTQRGRI